MALDALRECLACMEARLTCIECGEQDDEDGDGWRTYLTDDGEAVTYCPPCAEREFGAGAA